MSITDDRRLPWQANDIEPWCVEDPDGNHVAECDSPQIAAFIIQQANTYHRICKRGKEVAESYDPTPALAHHPGGAL